ncbi:CHASE3 domain-containing protein [Brevundimonas sp. DC300-4]|uniref:CHASE3 domain-containing protein n=1 Tax=Brevundimonas sp. DC300-4 TaxID=2804594 RepID=UPI003CF5B128
MTIRSQLSAELRFRLMAAAVLLVMAVIVVLAGRELYREFSRAEEARDQVQRSYETRSQIQSVFSLLQDAETGQRGYVITGEEPFLRPYARANADLDAQLEQLGELFSDHPSHSANYASLLELVARKRETLRQAIITRRDEGQDAAIAVVSAGAGRAAMDEIRVVIDRMTRREGAALDGLSKVLKARTQQSERLVAALFAVLVVVTCGGILLGARYLRTRDGLLADVQAAEARQRAILDSALDAIITLNPSGSIETANAAAERMFGYSANDLDRRDISLLIDVTGAGDGSFLSRLGASHGEFADGLVRELVGRKSTGAVFPVDVALGPMDLASGRHMVAVIRDITERRRVERMKDEFVSTVSHELRTPLTSIAGSLGLLAGGALGEMPAKAGRLIEIAHSNSQRLIRLINDILDVEKLQSGQFELELTSLDMETVVGRSIKESGAFAESLGVRVTLAAEGAAPVQGDPDRLTQVVTNLVSNAVKFSTRGGEVRLRLQTGPKTVRLSVIDDGPGISEAFRARIFGKFAQADSSDTRARGGTGLGLAIAKEISERHAGRLWFESVEGEGTTFHLDLPRAERAGGLSPETRGRLLICEPDRPSAKALATMLTVEGFDVDTTHSTRAALSLAGERYYAAVLVGLGSPETSGVRLIRALKERPDTRSLPVVVLSADLGPGTASLHALEVVDWMEKPFDQQRVNRAVRRITLNGGRSVVLHIEDDPDILEITRCALGQDVDLHPAETLEAARRFLSVQRPDLVILDLGLPDGNGMEILSDLADENGRSIPVVIYSAQEMDATIGAAVEAVLIKSRMSLSQLADTVRHLSRKSDKAS